MKLVDKIMREIYQFVDENGGEWPSSINLKPRQYVELINDMTSSHIINYKTDDIGDKFMGIPITVYNR